MHRIALLMVALAGCGYEVTTRNALREHFGEPCAIKPIAEAAAHAACDQSSSEEWQKWCHWRIDNANRLESWRYCVDSQHTRTECGSTCNSFGEYWLAEDECFVAYFNVP